MEVPGTSGKLGHLYPRCMLSVTKYYGSLITRSFSLVHAVLSIDPEFVIWPLLCILIFLLKFLLCALFFPFYHPAIQHESALDSLADTLRYQPEIRHVIYSTDARGKVLPMSGALMKSLCNGFLAGYNSIQLTISKVQITEQEIKNMVDLFSERSKLRTLTLSDCKFLIFSLLSFDVIRYQYE